MMAPELPTMIILPGITRAGGMSDPRGLLDRDSARAYAEERGYWAQILDVAEATSPSEKQITAALRAFRDNPDAEAFYGFSGGGYSLLRVLRRLNEAERRWVKLVVVLGSPQQPQSAFEGPWELVYRRDPPEGHMAGPRVLLREWRARPRP